MVELNAAAERHVGRIGDSRHSFGDVNALRPLLIDGGFSDVNVAADDAAHRGSHEQR
jgi:hypothetical protein